MKAAPHEWRACANVFAGHPAFILGNGPTLPENLSSLTEFFTIGVNRILRHYDPTVLMWFDREIFPDIEPQLYLSKAVCFTNPECNTANRWNALEPYGTTSHWIDAPLARPDCVVSTGNSGAAAAYWAMSLGCYPVYLLGMGAAYEGGRTNSYGQNPAHTKVTLRQLGRALRKLLTYQCVYPVENQRQLNKIAKALGRLAKGREWYLSQFRKRHAGAPRTKAGSRPMTIAETLFGAPERPHVVGRFDVLQKLWCGV